MVRERFETVTTSRDRFKTRKLNCRLIARKPVIHIGIPAPLHDKSRLDIERPIEEELYLLLKHLVRMRRA
jgi:hypothetical protein